MTRDKEAILATRHEGVLARFKAISDKLLAVAEAASKRIKEI